MPRKASVQAFLSELRLYCSYYKFHGGKMLISDHLASLVLNEALGRGADFAEIFVERTTKNSISLKNQDLESLDTGTLYGLGLRVIKGTEKIYLHTNDLSEKTLIALAKEAASALGKGTTASQVAKGFAEKPQEQMSPEGFPLQKKLSFLQDLSRKINEVDPLILQAMPGLLETQQHVQILNSEGLNAAENRTYTRLNISCLAQKGTTTERGNSNVGRTLDFSYLLDYDLNSHIEWATRQALVLLDAEYAPTGELPVVLNSGFGGVIFHEACGHGLETTAVAKEASVFCGQMGKPVASSVVTAVDDGTIDHMWGSIKMDDEGMPTQKTVLIENGVLKNYLSDRLGAQKMDIPRTGSGRRQSYKFAPASRMRNTYIAAGDSTLDEMVGDVERGIFAKDLGGGSVMPGTGAFNFAINEAYLIENGKITRPIKGASLIGTGIETLKRIKKVGKDLKLAAGTCGSVSGWVPVTVGQPPLLVESMTVGGRS